MIGDGFQTMRLLIVFVALAACVIVAFLIWEGDVMAAFSREGSITWLGRYGQWAWIAGIVLLMSDLLLPLPATLVMAALGYIYGPFIGGLIGGAGSFMSGAGGYWLCRATGEKAATWILGKRDFERGKKLSDRVGGWVVVLSRWLPIFPEVVACMAGLTRMNATMFHVALLCSSLPMGFIYAVVGHAGIENLALSVILSAGLPALIWLGIGWAFKLKVRN